MIEIEFSELPRTVQRALQVFEVPLSNALNKTAPIILAELREEMKQVFDKPTPYALNGFRVLYSKPANPVLGIKLKDEQVRGGSRAVNFLGPEIEGGNRSQKRTERAFIAKGTLAEGAYLMPGKGAQKDQYGNMSRQQIQQILADVRAYRDEKQRSKKRSGRGGQQYFIGREFKSGLGRTIFRGVTGRAIPVLVPVKNVSYKKRFDFFGTVSKAFDDNIEKIYDEEVLKFVDSFLP